MEYNYNYVYRITNKILNKHYYGVRSSDIEPKLDLGKKYFSSSSDKEFRKEQKENKLNYKYKIVRICSTRDEANTLEIKLHEKFNVASNESFYNRAKHTSTGFNFSGVKHTEESRQKMSKPRSDGARQKLSEAKTGENNPMFGKKHSDGARKKMSEVQKGENNPMFGKEVSPETRKKLSEANKGVPQGPQEQVQCPYCSKIGGISNMKRYHFDNCKYIAESR
jgi:group I intron endonuclease